MPEYFGNTSGRQKKSNWMFHFKMILTSCMRTGHFIHHMKIIEEKYLPLVEIA